jgi:hypothetical protein
MPYIRAHTDTNGPAWDPDVSLRNQMKEAHIEALRSYEPAKTKT